MLPEAGDDPAAREDVPATAESDGPTGQWGILACHASLEDAVKAGCRERADNILGE